jgi:hypothetical protein
MEISFEILCLLWLPPSSGKRPDRIKPAAMHLLLLPHYCFRPQEDLKQLQPSSIRRPARSLWSYPMRRRTIRQFIQRGRVYNGTTFTAWLLTASRGGDETKPAGSA